MRVREKTIKTIKVLLANGESAIQGRMAAINTADGMARDCDTAATTLLPIGRFAEDLEGTGANYVKIDLFEEVKASGFLNDSAPNAVAAAHIWSEIYIKDSQTVSTSSGGSTRSVAGRAIAIEGSIVYVQAGVAVTGPSGLGSDFSAGVADKTALKAVAAASRFDGMLIQLQSDMSFWMFDASSSVSADEAEELVIAPTAGTGRWIAADKTKVLKIPVDYSMSDGDAILTVPTGFVLRLAALPYWEVTTGFTGGSSSAIGVSTSVTGYETGGDILGGASGDVAATLVAGVAAGTLGGELDDHAGLQALALVAADELQFDAITSAFTAGAGYVCLPVAIATV